MKNTVSIIIITLNEEHYVGNLLDDLTAQQDIPKENLEVLVVDGGSTDKTKQVVESRAGALPVRFMTAPKRGWAAQKNFAVTQAANDTLMFFDADLRLRPETVSTMLQTLSQHLGHIIVAKVWADSPRWTFRIGAWLTYGYFRFLTALGQQTASDQCFAIDKATYNSLDGLDETMPHAGDIDFMLRARKKGIHVHWAPTAVYTSMRRFESVGTIRLLMRYMRSEIHRAANKGRVHKDYVGYTQPLPAKPPKK